MAFIILEESNPAYRACLICISRVLQQKMSITFDWCLYIYLLWQRLSFYGYNKSKESANKIFLELMKYTRT